MNDSLTAALSAYASGEIDWPALKKTSAGFGIYRQKNGLFMMRLRRTGGYASVEDLAVLSELMRRWAVPKLHLTTRQDFQLHDIRPEPTVEILAYCRAHAFPVLGGGGDTFRNVYLQPGADLTPGSVFPVRPLATALAKAFREVPKAYALPRKLKIAFADRPQDGGLLLAASNDLGFLATVKDGRPVFQVWVGGGLGGRPRLGLKLFDDLPAEHCIRLAVALTELFHAKGNRENRANARIRFLRDQLGGDETFAAELKARYASVQAPLAPVPQLPAPAVQTYTPANQWQQLAVIPGSAPDRCSVRLFVPNGNLTEPQLTRIHQWLREIGTQEIQILPSQDLLLCNLSVEDLPAIQAALLNDFADIDLTVRSFAGHIVTCVGNTVCMAGSGDPTPTAQTLAAGLDRLLPEGSPEKARYAKTILTDLRISGCPNSCAAHQTARFGYFCRLKDGQRGVAPYTPATATPLARGTLQAGAFIPDEALAQHILDQLAPRP